MSRKIFRSIMAAVGLVLLASMVIIVGCMYAYFGSVQEQQLQDGLSLAASAVEQGERRILPAFPPTATA